MGQFIKKILSPLVILSMEKTMAAKGISEPKIGSRLPNLGEKGPTSAQHNS